MDDIRQHIPKTLLSSPEELNKLVSGCVKQPESKSQFLTRKREPTVDALGKTARRIREAIRAETVIHTRDLVLPAEERYLNVCLFPNGATTTTLHASAEEAKEYRVNNFKLYDIHWLIAGQRVEVPKI